MGKTIAMMQPYLFPYLGYFQLIAAADVFVLSDDLQYIRGGWVNRNRILDRHAPLMITFPLKRDRYELGINERRLCDGFEEEAERLIKLLIHSYSRAPCFAQVMPFLERLIRYPQHNLALYIEHSIRELCACLEIDTPICRSSDLKLPDGVDKQDRVIQIANMFGASLYINPIGGTELYDAGYFARHDLALKFLKMDDVAYRQYRIPFMGGLSIIDVMMFNPIDRIHQLLACYSLQTGDRPEPLADDLALHAANPAAPAQGSSIQQDRAAP